MDQRILQTSRLAIGLAQGLLLYGLQRAAVTNSWPATDRYVFMALLTAGFFVPLIAISGLGNLRMRTFWLWLATATTVCVLLPLYAVYRSPMPSPAAGIPFMFWGFLPFWIASLLFIADNLVIAGDADRRLIARYPTLFEASWKHGIQAMLAILFTAILWAILYLGAALFALINVTLIQRTIAQPLFWIPVTAVSFAYALHIADVRANIVRGARTLLLVLLSWLLPVMTLLAIGFILTLPFTGLDVLWGTRRAATILLTSAGALVFLINAAYRNGDADTTSLLRLFRLAAAIVLLPIVALAAYALMLRIGQYGWSPERVTVAALIFIASCYALGYIAAAFGSRLSLRWLEPVNVGTSFAIIAALLALMSPLADPARISVNSQLARLQSGIVTPEKFDYAFLRARAGRFGTDALEAMAQHSHGPVAAVYAERMRSGRPTGLPSPGIAAPPLPPLETRRANITVVYPRGATFPDSFLQKDWSNDPRRFVLPRCMTVDAKCNAVLADLDGDGKDELLLFGVPYGGDGFFKQDADNVWRYEGSVTDSFCPAFRDALRRGEITVATPRYKEIEAGGTRARVAQSPCVPNVRATIRSP